MRQRQECSYLLLLPSLRYSLDSSYSDGLFRPPHLISLQDTCEVAGEYISARLSMRELVEGPSRRVTRVNRLHFLQKIAAVNDVVKLHGLADDLFGFGRQGFCFAGPR